jgi:hypothetical protein
MNALLLLVLLGAVSTVSALKLPFMNKGTGSTALNAKSIFEFDVPSTAGTISLSEYKGKKAYLIVNVASK